MSKYKIKVIKMGAYVAYLYKRRRLFWWELKAVAIDNRNPYSKYIIEWQDEYNIKDKHVQFDICRRPKTMSNKEQKAQVSDTTKV